MTNTDIHSIRTAVTWGGRWLGMARTWMQNNIIHGDRLTWGSDEPVTLSVRKLEEMAQEAAVGAALDERERACGPGTAHARFVGFFNALEERFPHPAPFDSTKPYESYFVEWLDQLIAASNANKMRGWVLWDGSGYHPTGDTKVLYRMRDDKESDLGDPSRAGDLDWSWTPHRYDWEIVAYKVVE